MAFAQEAAATTSDDVAIDFGFVKKGLDVDDWCRQNQLRVEGSVREGLAQFRFEKAEEMLAGKSRAERVRGLGGKLRRKKKPGRTFDTNQDLADKWLAAEPHWAYG